MAARAFLQRAVARLYSASANRLYEPVVIRTALRALGGRLEAAVSAQGRRAVEGSGDHPILDVPVGTAYFTVEVARAHAGLVVGVDIAAGMARRARATARAAGADNLRVMQADAHALPFADATFRSVLCTNGLQVMHSRERLLRELGRVLEPSGRLLVCVITLPLGAVLPRRAARALPTVLCSRREITEAMVVAGFEISSLTSQRLAVVIEATKE